MPSKKKSHYIFLLVLSVTLFANGQMFKTDTGSLEAISGVLRYNVLFEYSDNLEVPNYSSENDFLKHFAKKAERKEKGGGKLFKERWFSYRPNLYEPKFIQEFNFFNLKEKQVTVATNISDAAYTMVVRTTMIDPGGSNFFFKKNAWLKVYIRIYAKGHPEKVLYATEAIDVHSEGANSDVFNRILSAYSELGKELSRYLSRKT